MVDCASWDIQELKSFMCLGTDEERDRNSSFMNSCTENKGSVFKERIDITEFFTSRRFANSLLTKGSSIAGAFRQNRRELPPICKDSTWKHFSVNVVVNG